VSELAGKMSKKPIALMLNGHNLAVQFSQPADTPLWRCLSPAPKIREAGCQNSEFVPLNSSHVRHFPVGSSRGCYSAERILEGRS
jgi:hypothetical protein